MSSSQFRAAIFPLLAALITAITSFLGSGNINVSRVPPGLNGTPRAPGNSTGQSGTTTSAGNSPLTSGTGLTGGTTTNLRPNGGTQSAGGSTTTTATGRGV